MDGTGYLQCQTSTNRIRIGVLWLFSVRFAKQTTLSFIIFHQSIEKLGSYALQDYLI